MGNNYFDNESTVFDDNEGTFRQYSEDNSKRENIVSSPVKNEKHDKKENVARVVASAGAGVLIGGVATYLMSMGENPADNDFRKDDNGADSLSHPEWVDDKIDVATSVNDNMSFNEAFAAARAEVGPGGCFEWHGQVYGTYTAAEWNNMSAAEKDEYGSHFSWNHIDPSHSNVAHHHGTFNVDSPVSEEISDSRLEAELDNQLAESEAEGVELYEPDEAFVSEVLDSNPGFDQKVEILGVTYDSNADAAVGKMTIDDQEVILIDVDHDSQFDYMAVDVNNDGVIDTDELTPIIDNNLMVDDLGGFDDPADDYLASEDGSDFSIG